MAKKGRTITTTGVYCKKCNADYSFYTPPGWTRRCEDGDPCPECGEKLVHEEHVIETDYGPSDWCKDHGTEFNL